jgi:hypothetical protein
MKGFPIPHGMAGQRLRQSAEHAAFVQQLGGSPAALLAKPQP